MSSEKGKTVAAKIEKVSNKMPDDLMFSFLSKMPIKPLKRFGCVRKSWAILFQNPHFMSVYRNIFISKNHSYYDDTSLILQHTVENSNKSHSTLYLLSGERFESRVKLDFSIPCQDLDQDVIILGASSINGTLCLSSLYYNERKVVLWNPATRESKTIPPSPNEFAPYRIYGVNLHGFGYDNVSDDYKVIRHVICLNPTSYEPLRPLWEIYSLRSNSWNTLDVDMPMAPGQSVGGSRVYIDGMCHWLCERKMRSKEVYLVSFDMSDEVFFTTPMEDGSNLGFVGRDLVVLNGSIALITNYEETATFYISILGEIGVKESWTKLFTIEPLPCIEHPIGVGKKGDIFFIKKDGELAWFDLSTQMIQELGVKGETFCCQIVIYKESFIPIGGINN